MSSETSLIAIGASAGGLPALRALLRELPRGFLGPIVVILHLRAGVTFDFEQLFVSVSDLKTQEAEEKSTPMPGNIYIAPPGYHLLFEHDRSMSLSVEAPVNWARPSIDVTFETAAEAYGSSLAGVLLSGANFDGSRGLKCIHDFGGNTFVQDPASAEFPSMPRSALELFKPAFVLDPTEIGRKLGSFQSDA